MKQDAVGLDQLCPGQLGVGRVLVLVFPWLLAWPRIC